MPIIVSCPSCSGQLRVADDLVGRKVRCPACGTTFEAASPSAPAPKPAPRDEPAATEKVDAWKFLDLELKADPPPARPSPRPTRDPDEIPAAPRDPSPRRDGPRPRLDDDHDDTFACKVCGRVCHNDARRCPHCGERFDGDEDAPRRRRPRFDDRRDTEPHRAGFILAMGIVSLSLLLVCWPLSIVFGLIAWICGGGDLRKMRAGTMDPEGEGSTQAGWICGIIGTCLSAVVYLGCGTIIGMSWYETMQASRNMNQPRMVAPAPVPAQPVPAPPPVPKF